MTLYLGEYTLPHTMTAKGINVTKQWKRLLLDASTHHTVALAALQKDNKHNMDGKVGPRTGQKQSVYPLWVQFRGKEDAERTILTCVFGGWLIFSVPTHFCIEMAKANKKRNFNYASKTNWCLSLQKALLFCVSLDANYRDQIRNILSRMSTKQSMTPRSVLAVLPVSWLLLITTTGQGD